MNAIGCMGAGVPRMVQLSEMGPVLLRLVELIRQYGIYFFTMIGSFLAMIPFGYKMNLSGPKKIVSANLSLSLKRLAKMLPFQTWTPSIKVSVSFKFKKKEK